MCPLVVFKFLLLNKRLLKGTFSFFDLSDRRISLEFHRKTPLLWPLVAGTWSDRKKCITVDFFLNWQMIMCR